MNEFTIVLDNAELEELISILEHCSSDKSLIYGQNELELLLKDTIELNDTLLQILKKIEFKNPQNLNDKKVIQPVEFLKTRLKLTSIQLSIIQNKSVETVLKEVLLD